MRDAITNPDMKRSLDYYGVNQSNSSIFQHAYYAEGNQRINSSVSYLQNGLKLVRGANSFLGTMSPYPRTNNIANEIERPTNRGNHKLVISIPHELEEMVFGSKVNARGDAGNQYSKQLLIDYLINSNTANILPREFIVGVYVDATSTAPSVFLENPYFYNNKQDSRQNISRLKNHLFLMLKQQGDSPINDLVKFCFGFKTMTESKVREILKVLDDYDDEKGTKFGVLKNAVYEKLESERNPRSYS